MQKEESIVEEASSEFELVEYSGQDCDEEGTEVFYRGIGELLGDIP